jgi:hypothetical protein
MVFMSRLHPRNRSNPFYRPLAIAALVSAGILQPLLPVFAAGTSAGSVISNTATASYTDPNGQVLNSTSNQVTITVAEVAGLSTTFVAKSDVNGGAVGAGDTLNFDFQVTNTGNKATDIYIPHTAADLTLQNLTFGSVQYSTDGGTTYQAVPAATGLVSGVAPDASILVRVMGTVPANLVPGNKITVQLGKTGDFTNPLAPLNTQNRTDIAPNPGETDIGGEANDVRTVGGAPVNGQREAAALSTPFDFANTIKPLALAIVKKRNVSVVGNDPTKANDDKITYELGLDVANTAPLGSGFDPASLEGTPIKLGGAVVTRILVSDRIPTGTKLDSVDFAAIPAGWQPVYATDSNAPVQAAGSTETDWTLLTPANLATAQTSATRIGYIYTGTLNPGASISSLKFTVVTSGLTAASNAVVANIAQVFGQTADEPGNSIVYDESGDSSPNNFNGSTPPLDGTGKPAPSGTYYDPTISASGIANPATDGIDTGNNNGGSGPNGEDNVVSITLTSDTILNGPNGAPSAKGPNDENDDFSNASTALPAALNTSAPGASNVTATPVNFTNTVNNPSATATLSNVTLQPISPSQAEGADGIATIGQYGSNTSIPNGTLVTIKFDPDGIPGSGDEREATYSYTSAGGFTAVSSKTGTTADPTFKPVNTGTLAPGQSINYTTVVALPGSLPVLNGYAIPVVAFPDDNVNPVTGIGNGFTNETTNNITLDRVYTGYMQLSKEARILSADGVTPIDPASTVIPNATLAQGANSGWAASFNAAVTLQPGQFIEYRIKYNNISGPSGGSGNSVLTANNFTINEDGVAGPNTWSASTTHQQSTSVGAGTVKYYNGSTVAQNGTAAAPNDPINDYPITRYENNAGQVAPGANGQFQFRRKLK